MLGEAADRVRGGALNEWQAYLAASRRLAQARVALAKAARAWCADADGAEAALRDAVVMLDSAERGVLD